mgnify:CR=1 FL=1
MTGPWYVVVAATAKGAAVLAYFKDLANAMDTRAHCRAHGYPKACIRVGNQDASGAWSFL